MFYAVSIKLKHRTHNLKFYQYKKYTDMEYMSNT